MFDKVAQPQIDMYDGITNKYLGRSVFKVTPEAERAILNFAHNEKNSARVVLEDISLYPATADYTMPLPYKKYSRRGVLRAMLRDRYSLLWTPVEIRARFNIMGRAKPTESRFHFDSLELSDIVIEGMKVMPEQVSKLSK